MYTINKEFFLFPWDVFYLIDSYQMKDTTTIREKYSDCLVELRLYNYLRNLDLSRSQIQNKVRVLNFIKDTLMNDLFITFE